MFLSLANWRIDPRTKNIYLVLNANVFDYATHKERCAQYGAILPEPKNKEENGFLASLNTHTFFFGISRQGEREWRWESDKSLVSWTGWLSTLGEPDGGMNQPCVVMTRFVNPQDPQLSTAAWATMSCSNPDHDLKRAPMDIICQKKGWF